MKKFKFLFTIAFTSLFLFTACNEDEDEMQDVEMDDIVATAQATDNLSILVDALTQAGLVSTLQGDGPFTVFAPTNDAFQALLDSDPSWNSLSDIDNTVLRNILQFHVLATNAKAENLIDSYVTSLASGPNDESISLQIDVTGGIKFNGSANPITTDIETSNGIVHTIDEVMLPPSVVNLALNNPQFTSLVTALTRNDLTTDYVDVLSGDGPFTVFAPTNAAFQALLDSDTNWNSLNDIPLATLEAVLNYHVVANANVQSSQLTNEQSITSLGGNLTVNLSDGAKLETTSGQLVNIALPDVQGSNGVVHAVESVLLP